MGKKCRTKMSNGWIRTRFRTRILLGGLPSADKAEATLNKNKLCTNHVFAVVEPIPVDRKEKNSRQVIRKKHRVVAGSKELAKTYKDNISYFDSVRTVPNEMFHDRWYYVDKGNWGSARPGDANAFSKECFWVDDVGLHITNRPEVITGKDWDGNSVERKFASAELWSADAYLADIYAFKVKLDCRLGSWAAGWLYAIEPYVYSEYDTFEYIFDKDNKKCKLTFTTHWNQGIEREMFSRTIKVPFDSTTELLFETHVNRKKGYVLHKINGLTVYKSFLGHFDTPMHAIFGVPLSTFGGNVSEGEIVDGLPHYMNVNYFRTYEAR